MKNKFDKFAENCRKHPIRNFAIIFLVLAILPTIFIHLIYNIPVHNIKILKARIPAGNLLAYMGTVLTFCATFMLSSMVYLFNKDQVERMQCIENKALFLIDDEKDIEVDLMNPQRGKLDDIFIEMGWNVLSDAAISKIVMKTLSIEDLENPREREKQFFAEYENGKSVRYKYQENKNKIKIWFNLSDEKAQKILRKDHWIGISGDFDVYCENVKTSVTMNISCWSYSENEDLIAHMKYEIKDSNFFSHNASLC